MSIPIVKPRVILKINQGRGTFCISLYCSLGFFLFVCLFLTISSCHNTATRTTWLGFGKLHVLAQIATDMAGGVEHQALVKLLYYVLFQ